MPLRRKASLRDYARAKAIRLGKPLYNKKPVSSAQGRPVAASKPLAGSTLRKVSPKQSKRLAVYRVLAREYLAGHPVCEWCNAAQSTDLHHKARRGMNLCRVDTFSALCRTCHQRVHDHPKWAREVGLLI